jgi:3-hydroxyacyl-CoA dehydrogenase/enoyl-CoA hydratase/3-hydroxybutyryl-CoA epimerase
MHSILSLSRRPDGVALLTYDLPGEPVNTLQEGTAAALEQALAEVEKDPSLKAVVLASGKRDSFIVGADITMLRGCKTAAAAEALCRKAQAGFERLARFPKPIVAAIHGPCLGGGFELALACHGRVASDDGKTAVGLPEVQLGLLPGADGLQRVADLTSLAEALDLGLTGRNVKASRARKMGLVDEVVPASILVEAAAQRALALARGDRPRKRPEPTARRLQTLALEKNPLGRRVLFREARGKALAKTQGHYPAVERILDVLEAHASGGMVASREVEARAFGELVVSETSTRLVELFFATNALKKDPGVDDPTAVARPVERIAILGAGFMGAGIAYVSSNVGIGVRLKDQSTEGLARGLKAVSDLYGERVKRRSLTAMEQKLKMALVTGTTDYAGVAGADVVVEAVFEDLALKHRVLREVEALTGPGTIFASNTSSLPISRIAEASSRPHTVLGMHYFSPVHKMPLLEVIATPRTAPWATATAVALGKRQGKTVIVVNDGVGFYTTRILAPYMNEAAHLLAEGVLIEDIDRALLQWGWPVGPMALIDEVGIDVAAHVGPVMLSAFGDRMEPPATVTRLVDDGRKGRKNERGLYLYGAARKRGRLPLKKAPSKQPDPSVYRLLGVDPKPGKIPTEEIQMRCSLQFVNEALHCFGDGVLRSARDGDIGAIFGLGFPPFRGGPFRYVDTVGATEVLRRIRSFEDRLGKRWTPAPALVEMERQGKKFHTLAPGEGGAARGRVGAACGQGSGGGRGLGRGGGGGGDAGFLDRLEDDELDAAVLLAALGGLVVGDGLLLAVALGDEALAVDALLVGQVGDDGLGAALGERLVGVGTADVISVARDLDEEDALVGGEDAGDLVEDGEALVADDLVAVGGELDLIEDLDAVVGHLDEGAGSLVGASVLVLEAVVGLGLILALVLGVGDAIAVGVGVGAAAHLAGAGDIDALVLGVDDAVAVVIGVGAPVLVLEAVGIFRLVLALVLGVGDAVLVRVGAPVEFALGADDVGAAIVGTLVVGIWDAVLVRVGDLVGAAIVVVDAVHRLGLVGAFVGDILDAVAVVVVIGAAVAVLVAVLVLGFEGAPVVRVTEAIAVAVADLADVHDAGEGAEDGDADALEHAGAAAEGEVEARVEGADLDAAVDLKGAGAGLGAELGGAKAFRDQAEHLADAEAGGDAVAELGAQLGGAEAAVLAVKTGDVDAEIEGAGAGVGNAAEPHDGAAIADVGILGGGAAEGARDEGGAAEHQGRVDVAQGPHLGLEHGVAEARGLEPVACGVAGGGVDAVTLDVRHGDAEADLEPGGRGEGGEQVAGHHRLDDLDIAALDHVLVVAIIDRQAALQQEGGVAVVDE